jgi:hypothetical protein
MLNLPFSATCALTGVVMVAGGGVAAGLWVTGTVAARDIAVHTLRAEPGDSIFELDGSRTTDLDCYVYDRLDSLLGYDNGATDQCRITVRQPRAGDVRIEVENLGSAPNSYRLRLESSASRVAID